MDLTRYDKEFSTANVRRGIHYSGGKKNELENANVTKSKLIDRQ